MKKNSSTHSAFINPRALFGFFLVFLAVLLGLFAFGAAPTLGDGSTSKANSASWFGRLASAIGAHFESQKFAALPAPRGGGGGPFSKTGEPAQATSQNQTPTNYTGPQNDFRPVKVVQTRPLRELPMIPPALVRAREIPEPIRPQPPTQSGGAETGIQLTPGAAISAPTATGVSFEGVGVGIPGFVPSLNPPDTNGRVGATQYVQWNNASFAVFSKTGTLLYGPAAGNTLFQPLGGACASHNDGDPVVAYDILAGRWILSQFVVGASPAFSHQCVAVSQTQDATGAYNLYDFVTDTTNFVDYPKIGVWPDGYYMTGHIFNAAGTVFLAGRVYVFERDKMLAGLPARQVSKDLKKKAGRSQYGFLPADLDSLTPPPAGEASFILGPDPTSTNKTDSARVAVTWGATPTITLTEDTISTGISVAPCVNNTNGRDCVPEPPPAFPADYLDNLSFHYMYRLAYRNFGGSPVQESLVVNGTTMGGGGNPPHGSPRWFEFRNAGSSTTTPTVFQASTYDPDNAYRWMGSAAMDKDHNIALGYSKSSTSIKPGIYITGRLGTDPINTMGAEATVIAGIGSQTALGRNRWGDYSAMTLDPVDQCTFYYTNEYLPTNGGFNWATRIASYRFPSCTSAAAWGTVTGTITSCATGAPISGVTVTLSNGFAGATNASGVYSILVPAGSYTATAADADRNCASSTPASAPVTVTTGGTTNRNFCMTGASKLESNGVVIDDSTGNSNGVVNANECVKLNLPVKNNGCATETAISAILTTSTSGVTIVQGNATYPNLVIDASGNNSPAFQIQTSNSFSCGTNIALFLNLSYASGNKIIPISVPTCSGGPNQTIPSSSITTADLTQADRMGRDGSPSTCGGKECPGGGFPGTKYYKTYNFTNTGGAPACFTVTLNTAPNNPPATGTGDIESAAYLGSYDPTNLCLNYLGDSGVVGLGTSLTTASYSFTVPAQSNFVVVVNTTGTTTSVPFSGTVSGFFDPTLGPGPCPTTPTPTPTPTPRPHPGPH